MKEVLAAAGVPTARYATFADDEDAALAFLDTLPGLYVVKTDGLAAGKGVLVTESLAEATRRGARLPVGRRVRRRRAHGRDRGGADRARAVAARASATATRRRVPLAPAQDFKRIGDGDAGPNTGGMGAYSPVPIAATRLVDDVMERAVRPTLARARGARHRLPRRALRRADAHARRARRSSSTTCASATPSARWCCRGSTSDLARSCCRGRGRATRPLDADVRRRRRASPSCSRSEGYPAAPRDGRRDRRPRRRRGRRRRHGVPRRHGARGDGAFVTAGGRVLNVTALAPTIAEAREPRAYEAAALHPWPGIQYRTDIAASVVHR